jgi:hypothetical protein
MNDVVNELNDHDRAELEHDVRLPGTPFEVLVARVYPSMDGSFVYHKVGDIVTDLEPTQALWLMGLGMVEPVDPRDALDRLAGQVLDQVERR